MKKLELYECEFCGTKFSVKKDCEFCESCHMTPKRIVRKKYHSEKRINYPDWIEVEMCDGTIVKYKR